MFSLFVPIIYFLNTYLRGIFVARRISRKFVDYYILSTTSATIKGVKEKEEERERRKKRKREIVQQRPIWIKRTAREIHRVGRRKEGRVEERKRASSISQINASRKATLS